MTLHGVFIYDHDLQFIRSIEAPKVGYDQLSAVGAVWSQDGGWIVLPEHSSPDGAARGYEGRILANSETGELHGMQLSYGGEAGGTTRVEELIWSANNETILALKYESPFGLQFPYTDLVTVLAISNYGMSPIVGHYEGMHLSNIAWDENGITARTGGLQLSFDNQLNLIPEQPTALLASWWIANSQKTYEAAYKPDTLFYVREIGGQEQRVFTSAFENSTGEFVVPPSIEEIIWLLDNQHLIGIFGNIEHMFDEYPDLPRLLQGTRNCR